MPEFMNTLSELDPFWLYTAIFLIAFIENIFPPSPSDVVVVFGGALAVIGRGNPVIVLLAATVGSTLGFLAMYWIGKWFGNRILETGRIRFIPVESVRKMEAWFSKYGYWVIIGNRFLAGTRAVVSFFAGMSELRLSTTVFLSFVSSLVWHGILVTAGYSLGRNWEEIGVYLTRYSQIATALVAAVLLVFLVRFWIRKKKSGN